MLIHGNIPAIAGGKFDLLTSILTNRTQCALKPMPRAFYGLRPRKIYKYCYFLYSNQALQSPGVAPFVDSPCSTN